MTEEAQNYAQIGGGAASGTNLTIVPASKSDLELQADIEEAKARSLIPMEIDESEELLLKTGVINSEDLEEDKKARELLQLGAVEKAKPQPKPKPRDIFEDIFDDEGEKVDVEGQAALLAKAAPKSKPAAKAASTSVATGDVDEEVLAAKAAAFDENAD